MFRVPASELEPARNEISWRSLADLGPPEEVEWIWPGYLARGACTLLTGMWKCGKSTLLGCLLRDLYRGKGLVDTLIDAPVLIASEEPDGIWASRTESLGLDPHIQLLRRNSFTRMTHREWCEFIELVAERVRTTGAALVIIDSLANFWPVEDENDAGKVRTALTPLRAITQAGAAILLIHHPRKNEGGEFASARGSGDISAFQDILIEFGRLPGDGHGGTQRVLKAKGRYEGIQIEIVLDYTEEGYTTLGERGNDHPVRQARAQLKHFFGAGQDLSKITLSDADA